MNKLAKGLSSSELSPEREDKPQPAKIYSHNLFEVAGDGMLILDAESKQITDVNPFLCELLGYLRAEFLGKELWEIGFFKDKQQCQAAFEELRKNGRIRYEDLALKT